MVRVCDFISNIGHGLSEMTIVSLNEEERPHVTYRPNREMAGQVGEPTPHGYYYNPYQIKLPGC